MHPSFSVVSSGISPAATRKWAAGADLKHPQAASQTTGDSKSGALPDIKKGQFATDSGLRTIASYSAAGLDSFTPSYLDFIEKTQPQKKHDNRVVSIHDLSAVNFSSFSLAASSMPAISSVQLLNIETEEDDGDIRVTAAKGITSEQITCAMQAAEQTAPIAFGRSCAVKAFRFTSHGQKHNWVMKCSNPEPYCYNDCVTEVHQLLQCQKLPHVMPMLASVDFGYIVFIIAPRYPTDLFARLRDAKEHPQRFPLKLRDRCQIFADTCEGLTALHGRGISHCDLRASNILLTKDDRAVIGDLNNSRPLRDELPLVDTDRTDYAPEHHTRSGSIGKDEDIHGLGRVLLTLVSGRPDPQTWIPDQSYEVSLGSTKVGHIADPNLMAEGTKARTLLTHLHSRITRPCLDTQPRLRPASAQAVKQTFTNTMDENRIKLSPPLTVQELTSHAPDTPASPKNKLKNRVPTPYNRQ